MATLFDDRPTIAQYKNKGIDWRLPENRVEAFRRVFDTRMREGELDHWLSGKVIASYMSLTNEQKAWYCLIFGYSYRNHVAMILLQLYPSIWDVDVQELRQWYNDGNWKRMSFAKDTKWNVRGFPDFIESAQKWLNGRSLHETVLELTASEDSTENFDNLNSALKKNILGIGRMTSWLAIQTFYEFFNLNVDKWDLQLKDDGCWSQYDALCYLYNRLDLAGAQKLSDGSIQKNKKTAESIKLMNENTNHLMEKLNGSLPYHVDIFNVESCLCEYRKTAYGPRKIKEYTGWTIHELQEQFPALVELWRNHPQEIDWTPYVLGLMIKGQELCQPGYDKIYFSVLTGTGLNLNTHFYYPDEPSAYEEIAIPLPSECPQPELLLTKFDAIPSKIRAEYTRKFDPILHLRTNNFSLTKP